MNGNCREAWIDWMRVCACFLVMIVHSTEAFYFGGEGTQTVYTDMSLSGVNDLCFVISDGLEFDCWQAG